MKKTSLQDIANRLGVSKALVSFVLTGKGKENRISEQMIKRVYEVARELNYKPNQVSTWLRTGKTQTIGLIIADISNPFFGKLARQIEQEAYNQGFKIIICSSDENAEKSANQLEMLKKSMVDGIIFAPPPGSSEQVKSLNDEHIPNVLIDRYFPEIESNYVIIDNFSASYNATRHLLGKGYRKIVFLTVNNELVTMGDRTKGYQKAMADFSEENVESLVLKLPFSHQMEEVSEAIKHLLINEKKADAIIFSSSKIGLFGLEAIANLNLSIPDDVAVVSFDDPDYYKICYSPVSAIAQPLEEMGKEAVHLLVQRMGGEIQKSDKEKIVLSTNFIERKSSS